MTKAFSNKNILTGLALLVLGTILLLNNLNILPFYIPGYFFSWKALLIGLGLVFLLSRRFIHGLVLLFFGIYFSIPDVLNLKIHSATLLWPGLIIFAGLSIVFNLFSTQYKKNMNAQQTFNTDLLDAEVLFAGGNRKLNSYDFKGGRISAIFGGLEIDLTNCYLPKESTVINLNIIAGGVTLIIPKDWNLNNEVNAIMGGIEDESFCNPAQYIDPASTLTLKGSVLMGGIEIKRM